MSVETRVFIARSRLPSADDWAEAIHAANYPLDLDREFDPATFSGFLPCTYQGEESGFEYFWGPASASMPSASDAIRLGNRDSAVSFVTHSNLSELGAATIASSVLATLSDGLLYDCEAGEFVQTSSVKAWADAQLRGVANNDAMAFKVVGAPPAIPWTAIVVGLVVAALALVYVWAST